MKTNYFTTNRISIRLALAAISFFPFISMAQLYVPTTDKVGIGTAAPVSKLDVEGGVSIGAAYSGATGAPANGAIIEGNVGIGTVAPGKKFDVNGDALIGASSRAAGHAFLFLDAGTTTGNEPHFRFSQNTVLKAQIKWSSDAAGGIDFYTVGTGSFVRFTNLGNVGIGTPTPNDKLDVAGNVNLNAGTNAFKINGSKVLWQNNNITNIFVGVDAGPVTTGTYNSASGYKALFSNTSGTNNSAFGSYALYSNTTTSFNTGCGYSALTGSTGNYNTALGYSAGSSNTTGYNNTLVGYAANVSTGALSNATAIGNGAIVNASNKIRIGNTYSTIVIEGQTAWSYPSDGRFKNNITDEVKGLEFIKKLRPINYHFDSQNFDQFIMQNMPDSIKALYTNGIEYASSAAVIHTGFIAQEVEQAANDCGYIFDGVHAPVDDKDNYSLAYSQFVVPLVKAVQELSKITDSLTTVKTKQDSTINVQNSKIADLQNQIINCCAASGRNMGIINNGNDANDIGNMNGKAINDILSTPSAILYQNVPNPFNQQTSIQYFIPENVQNASIMVFDLNGKLMNTVPVTSFGKGAITINGSALSPGMFVYSLVVDEKIIDTKRMILTH
jgi:hypothetical protein